MRPTVLIILDGFGFNPNLNGNAIAAAKTPNLDSLWSNYPHTLIKAAEEEVGLNFGQIGNSEVGHLAIGTGRVIPSPLQRINNSIDDGSFFTNTAFLEAIKHVIKHQSRLHIIGLASSAGVHAELNHQIALLKLAKKQGIKEIYFHPILDGRDTGPKEATIYLERLEKAIKEMGRGKISTITGRAYAMDRNNNWERIEKFYNALLGNSQQKETTVTTALKANYSAGLDDENILPTIIDGGEIKDNDAIIFTNFREDRARQMTKALSESDFKGFPRPNHPLNLLVTTMTQYENGLHTQVAFSPIPVSNTLSDILEANGAKQLHIAETEKYAHVTYFFNGGREAPLPHEEFINIPSDPPQKFLDNPSMQADKITQKVLSSLQNKKHDFIIINFANPDMIGHTGNYKKTVAAIESLDINIGKIASEVLKENGFLFITSDHGNAELKIDLKTGNNSKDHTISPVPFIFAAPENKIIPPIGEPTQSQRITFGSEVTGILQDVSPTILTALGLPIPSEMTGASLF